MSVPTSTIGRVKPSPSTWTGPIPADAVVTQTPGSPYNTYTWRVIDSEGYTTTHWYRGPLNADRTPTQIRVPALTESASLRQNLPSWTGPIPDDATVTQKAGSPYKTYTWKATDANGYTTTHWYSGPLAPDGSPAQFRIPSFSEPLDFDQDLSGTISQSHESHRITSSNERSNGQAQQPQPQRLPNGNRGRTVIQQHQQHSVTYQGALDQSEPVRVSQPEQTIEQHIAALDEYDRQQQVKSLY